MKFTDTFIKNLKPETSKFYKREANGFTVKVWPSGNKTWCYVYTFDGRRKEMKLGEYPAVTLADARTKYNAAYELHKNGVDPGDAEHKQQEGHRASLSVSSLADKYIEEWAKPNKRSWLADKRTLDVEIIPKWGQRKAKDIQRRDVKQLLQDIATRAPVMANRTRALLSKLFNFALEWEIVELNPCMGVKAVIKEEPATRTLTDDEIKELWDALETPGTLYASPEILRCLKLILLTGQRPGEVVGMHSAEIDGQWWTIPAERAKNGRDHRVFLTETARGIIGSKAGFVFESPTSGRIQEDGTPRDPQPIAVNALAHVTRRNVEKPKDVSDTEPTNEADQEETDTIRRKLIMQPWTPHDLRRTCATKLSELGYTDEIIDAVLNHKKKGIVATYNLNRYDREKQKALETWGRKLDSIITGTVEGYHSPNGNEAKAGTASRTGNVVDLNSARHSRARAAA